MDKLTEYPKLIKRILTEYIELCDRHSQQDIETFLITDEQNGHYIWMNLGRPHGDRITGMTVYLIERSQPIHNRSKLNSPPNCCQPTRAI